MRAISTSPMRQCRICSAAMSSSPDQIGGLFGHHHDRCVGVAADNTWKNCAVHYAERFNAPDSQGWVHHGLIVDAHAAAPHRMMESGGCLAEIRFKLDIA